MPHKHLPYKAVYLGAEKPVVLYGPADSLWHLVACCCCSVLQQDVCSSAERCACHRTLTWFGSGKEGSWSCDVTAVVTTITFLPNYLGPPSSTDKTEQQLLAPVWGERFVHRPSHLHVDLGGIESALTRRCGSVPQIRVWARALVLGVTDNQPGVPLVDSRVSNVSGSCFFPKKCW